jgi:hypothetical protein
MAEDNVADRTTGVVEIEIDTPWADLGERGLQIVALVIDRRVIAEQLAALGDLCRSAGNPDGPATGEFCDLADRRADRRADSRADADVEADIRVGTNRIRLRVVRGGG